jgi:hypothetical protein
VRPGWNENMRRWRWSCQWIDRGKVCATIRMGGLRLHSSGYPGGGALEAGRVKAKVLLWLLACDQFLHNSRWHNAVVTRDETAGASSILYPRSAISGRGRTKIASPRCISNPFVGLSPGIPIPQTVRDVSDRLLVTFSYWCCNFCCRRRML